MFVQMKTGLVLTLLAASILSTVARESIAPGHFATKLEVEEASKKAHDPSVSKKTESLVGDLLSATTKDKEEPEAVKQDAKTLGKAAIGAAQKAAADKAAAEKAAATKAAAEKAAAEKAAAEKAATEKAVADDELEEA
eukprot:gnl/TRDRNA2_/TRDRNA2_173904_c4_seq1.p1 gnl/TRDRNA2_/TRDRNA2_173904_c4~~gnl/TRDRNA2_/TRDRNA2_173904_c4_seq1.p1  ORF type:complete len:138 (+),score=56.88 gnl/TRDRNA2_/TRDRNA2_173904_c4_seq1:79-492(+)